MTTATTSPPTSQPLMLDWLVRDFDATLVEHRVIDGDLESVYRAVTSVDMVEIPKSYPPVRALFAARGAAERLVNALLGRPAPTLDADGPMRLGDLPVHGEWIKLSDDPPWEFTFGVIGRFWRGETVWETIDAADFVAFEQPGFAKIACSVTLRPYGSVRTLSLTRPARKRSIPSLARRSCVTGASSAPASRL